MKNARRNWKTTIAGIFALAITGLQVYQNPASLLDPSTFGGITAGVGLILAKDGDKSGTAEVPPVSNPAGK